MPTSRRHLQSFGIAPRRAPLRRAAGAVLLVIALLCGLAASLGGVSGTAVAGPLAAEAAPASPTLAVEDPFDGLLFRTVLGLALFAIALAVVLFIVRRRFGARPFESGRRLSLLETLPLGGRRFVCLLSLDRERLLVVGVSGEGFSLLSDSRETAPPAANRPTFESALESARGAT